MRVELFAALAVASMLGACASPRGLHPNGQMTEPAMLHAERSLAGSPADASWPAQDWWTALGDPQLAALIEEALRDNPNLAEADALAQRAQAAVRIADAAREPDVNLDAGALGARMSQNSVGLYLPEAVGTFGWLRTTTLDFSWGLDLWGGKRAAWEAALGRARAAEIDRHAARIRLSVNVARAYVQLREAFAEKDIAERNLERSKRIAELTHLFIASGLGNPDTIHQVRSESGTAEQRLAQAELAIDAARTSLAVLLGKGPDRGLDIAAPAELEPLTITVPNDLPMQLLGRRADLTAARWRVEAAAHGIDAAKAQFLPNISIGAMAGVIALGPHTDLYSAASRTFNVGPAFSLPLFAGKRLRAELAAADADYDETVAHYNAELVRAIDEVADLLAAQKSLQTQLELQHKVLDSAQRAWDDAQTRYRAGLGSELDTLIVRAQLLAAENNLAVLQSRQADTAVRLIDALGGGFQE